MLAICKDIENLDVESLNVEDAMLLKEYVEALKKRIDKRAVELAKVEFNKARESDPEFGKKSIEVDGFMITEKVTDEVSLPHLKAKRTSLYKRLIDECFDIFSLTAKGKKDVLIKARTKWLEDAGEEELHITAPDLQKVLTKRIGLSQGEVDAIMDDCLLEGDVTYTITRKAKAGKKASEDA